MNEKKKKNDKKCSKGPQAMSVCIMVENLKNCPSGKLSEGNSINMAVINITYQLSI
jgi:hypothetical protein